MWRIWESGKYKKKYILFFTLVPLLTALSLISRPCPICNGTGEVDILPGMENVHILSVTGDQITTVQNVCEMYTLFQYNMTVRLTNTSHENIDGWLKLVLRDYSNGTMLDRQYVQVSIPAEATSDAHFNVWFRSGLFVPITIEVHAEQVTDKIADEACGGSGKLPLNKWFLVNSLKGKIQEVSSDDQGYIPPAPFFPSDGGSWSE